MTDENLSFEINWDLDVDHIEDSGPRIMTDYGALQYLGAKKVQLFATGEKVFLPNLIINGQPFSKGGMKEGHAKGGKNAVAHFFAFFGRGFTDDKEFTSVRIFTTQPNIPVDAEKVAGYPVITLDEKQTAAQKDGKTVWLSDWSNLQFPAIKTLSADARAKLTKSEKLFVAADNWNTGTKPRESTTATNDDGSAKKYYDKYWYQFVVFASEAEMLAARSAAKGGAVLDSGVDDLPKEWVDAGGDRQGLYGDIKERYDKGQPFKVIVKKCDLEGDSVNNGPVDAKRLVAAALDQPEELLESWFAA